MTSTRRAIRFVVLSVAIATAAGCASVVEEARRSSARPVAEELPRLVSLPAWYSLGSARQTARIEPAGGMPRPAGSLPMVQFVRPHAIAARGLDVFVADAGLGAVFRVDAASQLVARVAGGPTYPGVKLDIGPDRSLWIVDPATRRIWRMTPDARAPGELTAPPAELGRPVDVAVDPRSGQVIVADGLYRQVLAFHPAGHAYRVVPLQPEPETQVASITAISVGPSGFYVVDPACPCVVVVDFDGHVRARIGKGRLVQPGPIALDAQGRLFVADHGDRQLRIFAGERLLQSFGYAALNVTEVTDLDVTGDALYIVDGPGARIEVRRVVARPGPR